MFGTKALRKDIDELYATATAQVAKRDAEIERLRAAHAEIAHLRDQPLPIPDPPAAQPWGDGFATAHQMVLNILNRAIPEQKARMK